MLEAVHKRIEAEETREYAARKEEATEMRDSQACILSGGVYLRHRLKKRAFQKISLLRFSQQRYYTSTVWGVQNQAFRRAGVQEAVT